VLLHLDYHGLNVMTDGERITGVLDWANALAGDPRACFARTYMFLKLIPATFRWTLRLRVSTWLLTQAWKRGYQQVAGSLRDMELFYAWAGAVTVRDFTRKPEAHGLEPFIEPMHRWTATWKRRAGLPE
jgi:aminoglycoside phosphotransferase (APT) family kinase protein